MLKTVSRIRRNARAQAHVKTPHKRANMSWLDDLVKNALSKREPVSIRVLANEEDDVVRPGASVFIRGSSFGMELPKEVVMGLEQAAEKIRAKGQLDGVCEFYHGAVFYIGESPGVLVVQPTSRVTKYLKRRRVHDDCGYLGYSDEDEDDEVDCKCADAWGLQPRMNMEGRVRAVGRKWVPVTHKYSVEFETACAICMTPENVDQLLRAFPKSASTKRQRDEAKPDEACAKKAKTETEAETQAV